MSLQYRVRCEAIVGTERWRDAVAGDSYTIYSGHPQGVLGFREKPKHTDAEIVAELRRLAMAFGGSRCEGLEPGTRMAWEAIEGVLRGDF